MQVRETKFHKSFAENNKRVSTTTEILHATVFQKIISVILVLGYVYQLPV